MRRATRQNGTPPHGGERTSTHYARPWGGQRINSARLTMGGTMHHRNRPHHEGGHAPTQRQSWLGKQHKRICNLTADPSHPNTPIGRGRRRRGTNKTSRTWRWPRHHLPEPTHARRQEAQITTTQAKHQPAKTTANQQNAPGAPRSQNNKTHARQAAPSKTLRTGTQRNRLRTRRPSHGAPNSEHGVYTAPDDNGQRNTYKGRPEHGLPTAKQA